MAKGSKQNDRATN